MDSGQRQNWEEGEEMINDNSRGNKALQAGGYLANCSGLSPVGWYLLPRRHQSTGTPATETITNNVVSNLLI